MRYITHLFGKKQTAHSTGTDNSPETKSLTERSAKTAGQSG